MDTRHNLSATGPGRVRAGTTEVCAFCHTPHRAATTRALWSRDLPPVTYTLYTSSTLEATPAQPTGATRLCLSCHDGTTALGLMRTSSGRRRLALGPITGRANLGTDLSDDHPVSFEYTTALARAQGQLVRPGHPDQPRSARHHPAAPVHGVPRPPREPLPRLPAGG